MSEIINLKERKLELELIELIDDVDKIGKSDTYNDIIVKTIVSTKLKGNLKFITTITVDKNIKVVNMYSNRWYALMGHDKWLERVKQQDFDFNKYKDMLGNREPIINDYIDKLKYLIEDNKKKIEIAKKHNFYDIKD